jgi:PKD repeat protein
VPSGGKPVVINGSYTCSDSDPTTWSQNQASGGAGFCKVYVTKAVPSKSAGKKPGGRPKKPAKPKKPPKPKGGGKLKCGKGKLAIKANPDTGKPPLTVTFTLCSPKVVQWRIDFGDGAFKVAIGSPPSSIAHTYKFEGDFRPTLTVLAAPGAPSASSASTSVSVHFAQLISLSANPASGPAPLRVTFTLGTTVKNITQWSVDFGDGHRVSGAGKPPASVTHTYAADGNYRASFAVKPGVYALVATFAQVTVGAGTPPVLSLTANPTSGRHPLSVTFTTQVNIPGHIVSWVLRFGDGQSAGGQGRPPATINHTYGRAGTYGAYLIVAQQQQYGGVQYIVPRGGLGIYVS